jgi:hypothetical protein
MAKIKIMKFEKDTNDGVTVYKIDGKIVSEEAYKTLVSDDDQFENITVINNTVFSKVTEEKNTEKNKEENNHYYGCDCEDKDDCDGEPCDMCGMEISDTIKTLVDIIREADYNCALVEMQVAAEQLVLNGQALAFEHMGQLSYKKKAQCDIELQDILGVDDD